MAIPPLLDELLRAPGPSGSEEAVSAIVRREAAALGAELERDALGSTVARVRGTGRGRALGLYAHVDQVGLSLTRIDDDGRARVANLGVWAPSAAVGRRFRVLTASGEVPAVAVRVGKDGEPGWGDIRLDLGAGSADEARALVAPGDPAVAVGEPIELAGGRITSAALDDRLGVFVALEALRQITAAPPAWDVFVCGSVQEEGGSHGGAAVVSARLRPDVALVVECTYASDAPSGPEPWGDLPLGGGPAVFRGPVVHPGVAQGLLDAAAAAGVAVGVESGEATWSDADDVFAAGEGTPTGLLSIPIRHMHTASEIGQLSDVTAAIELVVAYARSLGDDASFVR